MNGARHFGRNGLTLIEVIAGIALLSTLLVGLLLGFGRLAKQSRAASRVLQATAAADRLLASWQEGGGGMPMEQSGVVGERGSLVWTTRVINDLGPLGIVVVRLALYGRGDSPQPLVTVDVLAADQRVAGRGSGGSGSGAEL